MPRKASITPAAAVAIIEKQRSTRRATMAAYRSRKAAAGARTVQVLVPDEIGAALLRRVAVAMRDADRAALDDLAERLRAYRPMIQPSLRLDLPDETRP